MKFLLMVLCFSFSFLAFGGEEMTGAIQKIAEYMAPILAGFHLKYPNVGLFLSIMTGMRIIMKPLMSLLWAIANVTSVSWDNELLKKIENHKAYKVFYYLLDYAFSIKVKNPKKK